MKVWKVTVVGYGKHITADYSTVEEEIRIAVEEEMSPDSVIVEEAEMSQEEIDALPEFQGF
jgi:hypothetical protein